MVIIKKHQIELERTIRIDMYTLSNVWSLESLPFVSLGVVSEWVCVEYWEWEMVYWDRERGERLEKSAKTMGGEEEKAKEEEKEERREMRGGGGVVSQSVYSVSRRVCVC